MDESALQSIQKATAACALFMKHQVAFAERVLVPVTQVAEDVDLKALRSYLERMRQYEQEFDHQIQLFHELLRPEETSWISLRKWQRLSHRLFGRPMTELFNNAARLQQEAEFAESLGGIQVSLVQGERAISLDTLQRLAASDLLETFPRFGPRSAELFRVVVAELEKFR